MLVPKSFLLTYLKVIAGCENIVLNEAIALKEV